MEQENSFEQPDQEFEISEREKKFYYDIKKLIKDFYIDENIWWIDEIMQNKSEQQRKEFIEHYQKNKLTTDWFDGILTVCQIAIEDLIDSLELKIRLREKCKNLINKIYKIRTKEGKTNRDLIKKAENLAREIENYIK